MQTSKPCVFHEERLQKRIIHVNAVNCFFDKESVNQGYMSFKMTIRRGVIGNILIFVLLHVSFSQGKALILKLQRQKKNQTLY